VNRSPFAVNGELAVVGTLPVAISYSPIQVPLSHLLLSQVLQVLLRLLLLLLALGILLRHLLP
jgi:hypothetical protein